MAHTIRGAFEQMQPTLAFRCIVANVNAHDTRAGHAVLVSGSRCARTRACDACFSMRARLTIHKSDHPQKHACATAWPGHLAKCTRTRSMVKVHAICSSTVNVQATPPGPWRSLGAHDHRETKRCACRASVCRATNESVANGRRFPLGLLQQTTKRRRQLVGGRRPGHGAPCGKERFRCSDTCRVADV